MTRSWISTILLILGSVIVLAFVTAALAPWFITWNDYRGEIEDELSTLTGFQVDISGDINVRLVPSPLLDLGQVSLRPQEGTAENPAPFFTSDQLTILLDTASLLDFQLTASQVKLEKPIFNISRLEDGGFTVEGLSQSLTGQKGLNVNTRIDRLEITDGAIHVIDPALGETQKFELINGDASLSSLSGPYSFEGGGQWRGQRFNVSLDVGVLKAQKSQSTIRITSGTYPILLTLRGGLDFNAATFEGNTSLYWYSADENFDNDQALEPLWAMTSPFTMSPSHFNLDGLALQFDERYHKARLRGAFNLDWQGDHFYRLDLGADHIRIDSADDLLSVSSLKKALDGFSSNFIALWPETWRGEIDMRLPSIEVSGQLLQNNQLNIRQTKLGWSLNSLKATLPGEAELSLSLDAFKVGEPLSSGQVSFNAGDTATTLEWLLDLDAEQKAQLGRFIPSSIAGAFNLENGRWVFSDMALLVGESQFRGAMEYGRQGPDVYLNLAGTSSRLDINTLQRLNEAFDVFNNKKSTKLPTKLGLSLGVDQIIYRRNLLKGVNVQAKIDTKRLVLSGFDIKDYHGLSLSGKGQISFDTMRPSGQLIFNITSEQANLGRILSDISPQFQFSTMDLKAQASGAVNINAELDVRTNLSDLAIVAKIDGDINKTTFNFDGSYYTPIAAFNISPLVNGQIALDYTLKQPKQGGLISALLNLPQDDYSTPIAWTGSVNGNIGSDFTTSQLFQLGAGFINIDGQIDDVSIIEQLKTPHLPLFNGTVTLDNFRSEMLQALPTKIALPFMEGLVNGSFELSRGTLNRLELNALNLTWGEHIWRGALALHFGDTWHVSGNVGTARMALADIVSLFGQSNLTTPSGEWLERPFNVFELPGWTFELGINADVLTLHNDLIGQMAHLGITYEAPELTINLDGAGFLSGEVQGSMIMRALEQGGLSLISEVNIIGVKSEDFIWDWYEKPVLTGEFDTKMILSGQGISPAGLAASLNGSADMSLQPGTIRGLSDHVFEDVVKAHQQQPDLSSDQLTQFVEQQLDAGDLKFKQIKGHFSIDSGLVKSQDIRIIGLPMRVDINARLDLNTSSLKSQWLIGFNDEKTSTQPEIEIIFTGPLQAPKREINVARLEAYLNDKTFEDNIDKLIKLDGEGATSRGSVPATKKPLETRPGLSGP